MINFTGKVRFREGPILLYIYMLYCKKRVSLIVITSFCSRFHWRVQYGRTISKLFQLHSISTRNSQMIVITRVNITDDI